jgi:hypothetical protein
VHRARGRAPGRCHPWRTPPLSRASPAAGSAWIVDPEDAWSAAALFTHPAGYGLDLAATLLGVEPGRDPVRDRPTPATGWYVNPYAGLAQVAAGGELRLNGRSVRARCVADGAGVVVNATRIVIGAMPYDPIAPPDAVPDPSLAGTYTSAEDEITVDVGSGRAAVRSARRGESPAVAMTPTALATDLGVLELRNDDLIAGSAYLFRRA